MNTLEAHCVCGMVHIDDRSLTGINIVCNESYMCELQCTYVCTRLCAIVETVPFAPGLRTLLNYQ